MAEAAGGSQPDSLSCCVKGNLSLFLTFSEISADPEMLFYLTLTFSFFVWIICNF